MTLPVWKHRVIYAECNADAAPYDAKVWCPRHGGWYTHRLGGAGCGVCAAVGAKAGVRARLRWRKLERAAETGC